VATLGFVALVCPSALAQETETQETEEGGSCHKACYERFDRCSDACGNEVDNNLCAQECIDEQNSCTEKCEAPDTSD
jgi:hypothetical protein